MERKSHSLFKNCEFEKGQVKSPKSYKKSYDNYSPAGNSGKVTKAGKRADSSKQQEEKVNPDILRGYFLSDPVIRQAIQTDVDNVCAGYYFEMKKDNSESEAQIEHAKKIFLRDNFMEKWRNIQTCQGVYDDAYQEIKVYLNAEGEIVFDSYILETPTIEIKNKETGEIKHYEQKIQGKIVAELSPDEIIHYRFNAFGDRDYGLSLMGSVLYSGAIRKFIEKYNVAIFQNHKPRSLWLFPEDMDVETYNDNVDLIQDAKSDPNKDIYLRGTEIQNKAFVNQKDIDFIQGYKIAREEIITGLGVPPIMLGLPEGSNKASGDTQLQAYDRRTSSKQESFAYKINSELMPKLGLDLIEFKTKKPHKRDEIRELDIVNKMKGLVTLNEARLELGKPELDLKEYPEANQIWKDGQTSSNGFSEETRPSVEEDFEKALKKKDKKKIEIVAPKVLKKKENSIINDREKFWNKVKAETNKVIDNLKGRGFLKQLPNIDAELSNVTNLFLTSTLASDLLSGVNKEYQTAGDKVASKLGLPFNPFLEELDFLKGYNLDLVKVKNERELGQIKQRLEIGIMNNQSATELKKSIDQIRKTAKRHTETLVRTEMNRANNMGGLQAMIQSGATAKKYLNITFDNRTSPQSKLFFKKYGTIQQAIPLDEEFKITYKGKVYSGLAPPFMPNDRDALVYTAEL